MHTSAMRLEKKIVNIVTIISVSLFYGGCATIVKDDSQPVAFSSEPQGAMVKINAMPRGNTPITIMVEREFGKQMVSYELNGYHPITFPLKKSVAGMTFGNIIFGGIIGIGVDVATGKATNYQDAVHVLMTPLDQPMPEVIFPENESAKKEDTVVAAVEE